MRVRLPTVAWLTVVWVLLWGTFTPLTLVGGVLVAVVVAALFPLPSLTPLLVRPWPLLRLVGHLAFDLVVSTAEVGWQVLRRGPSARGAIVAVPLLTDSDRVITVMANALSLSPGTMALEIDAERGVWYVYTLGPRTPADVDAARARLTTMQRRVLAAVGTRAERPGAERAS